MWAFCNFFFRHSTHIGSALAVDNTSAGDSNILTVLYICIFVTGGGYACYFMGMERTSPMQGSLVFFFKPILAPLLAMFILGESISWNMWCGIGLILVASLISMLPTLHILHGLRHLPRHFPHHFGQKKH